MPDNSDAFVIEIIREITTRGRTSGVSFHQRPAAAARYPTKAILTAVRMLAEEAEAADDSAMAAGLREMIEQCDANVPIEIEFAGPGPVKYIAKRRTEHGFWWRYAPTQDEPGEMFVVAFRLAATGASEEARKSGKTYIVASSLLPSPAVYVFACDHSDAGLPDMQIMLEFLPDGRRSVRDVRPRSH